jgi:hypothetical protein
MALISLIRLANDAPLREGIWLKRSKNSPIRQYTDTSARLRYASGMHTKRLGAVVLATAIFISPALFAQQALLLTSASHDAVKLSGSDLNGMVHITVTVHNPHANADETYSGVRVADLLAKLGAPLDKELRGAALANYIVATGSDNYKAVLALAEVDPSFHPGEVIVADATDGKPLGAHSGPFKLVVTEDKRPARSVRNLASVELKSVP